MKELEIYDVSPDEIIAEWERELKQMTLEERSQYEMRMFEIYTSKCTYCKKLSKYCTCIQLHNSYQRVELESKHSRSTRTSQSNSNFMR